MKLAANISLLYKELPLLDRIAAAVRDGFDGVEIQYPYEVDAQALRRALADAGTTLALINTPPGPNGEPGFAAVAGEQARFRDALQRALDMASTTGCGRIHLMPGRPVDRGEQPSVADGSCPAPAWHAVMLDNLRWAAPLARERSIVLALEPLNRWDQPGYAYHCPGEVLPLLQRLDEPHVGLQFDLYHVGREGLDLLAELDACRPWIRHVQIAEPPGRTAPDLSRPGVAEAISRLVDWRCSEWLSAEYKPTGPTADSLGWMPAVRRLLSGQAT